MLYLYTCSLGIVLIVACIYVGAADGTDEAYQCTEPASGDVYDYVESTIMSLSVTQKTSTITVTYIKNLTSPSNQSLYHYPAGHITLVYSKPFNVLSTYYAESQGPYSIEGSNSTDYRLLHLNGYINNSPRIITGYSTLTSLKPKLLALILNNANNFCCFGDCSLAAVNLPTTPEMFTSPSSLSPAPANPPDSNGIPTASQANCQISPNDVLFHYNQNVLTNSTTNETIDSSMIDANKGALLVTITSSMIALHNQMTSPLAFRLIFSGQKFEVGPSFNMKVNATTTTLMTSATRYTIGCRLRAPPS